MREFASDQTSYLNQIEAYVARLPSLSTTATKVLETCNNPKSSPNDLNRLIALDPVLAGQVLRLINSAYYSLNHPLLCLGLRFEYNGKVCCTAYDTEPFQNFIVTDSRDPAFDAIMAHQGEAAAREENSRGADFFADADRRTIG